MRRPYLVCNCPHHNTDPDTSLKVQLATPDNKGSLDDPSLILDELFQYSRAIRQSGALRRLEIAPDYVEKDWDGLDLTKKFREAMESYLSFRLRHVKEVLRNRILETICLRQRSFAFRRSRLRAGKEGSLQGYGYTEKTLTQSSKSLHVQSGDRTPSSYVGPLTNILNLLEALPEALRTRLPEALRARLPEVRRTRKMTTTLESNGSTFKISTSQILEPDLAHLDMSLSHEELPSRPKVSPGEKEQQCPYCLTVCPVSDFKDCRWPYVVVPARFEPLSKLTPI